MDCQDEAGGNSNVEILRLGSSAAVDGIAVVCISVETSASDFSSAIFCSSVDVRGLLMIDFRGMTFSDDGTSCADGPA